MLTHFQLAAIGLFVVIAAVAYRAELLALLKKLVPSKLMSPAVVYVREMVAIAELRDKLSADNCAEGVDACTNLLRVMVEKTYPPKANPAQPAG